MLCGVSISFGMTERCHMTHSPPVDLLRRTEATVKTCQGAKTMSIFSCLCSARKMLAIAYIAYVAYVWKHTELHSVHTMSLNPVQCAKYRGGGL